MLVLLAGIEIQALMRRLKLCSLVKSVGIYGRNELSYKKACRKHK